MVKSCSGNGAEAAPRDKSLSRYLSCAAVADDATGATDYQTVARISRSSAEGYSAKCVGALREPLDSLRGRQRAAESSYQKKANYREAGP